MNMLFLGHIKSNFYMIKAWFEKYKIFTPVGKSFNILLSSVSALKLKHFQAHRLANSNNGICNYVSKNYLCLGRLFKYMIALPKVQHKTVMTLFEKIY